MFLDAQTFIIMILVLFLLGFTSAVILTRLRSTSSNKSSNIIDDLPHLVEGSQIVRKEITWKIISDTLVSPAHDRVRVLYNDETIDDARLVILRIWNIGNVPVLPQDYENNNPIEFDFGEKAKVLDTEILRTTPPDIKDNVPFRQEDEKILLGPLLLNSLDSITFKVLLTNFSGEVRVNARIAGVKQIHS